jgi:hypothetical protein
MRRRGGCRHVGLPLDFRVSEARTQLGLERGRQSLVRCEKWARRIGSHKREEDPLAVCERRKPFVRPQRLKSLRGGAG